MTQLYPVRVRRYNAEFAYQLYPTSCSLFAGPWYNALMIEREKRMSDLKGLVATIMAERLKLELLREERSMTHSVKRYDDLRNDILNQHNVLYDLSIDLKIMLQEMAGVSIDELVGYTRNYGYATGPNVRPIKDRTGT